MPQQPSPWRWSDGRFMLRVALAFVAVPVCAPALMALLVANWRDAAGVILIYGIFSFAAMVVLGGPLLALYTRMNWSGYTPFVSGGAICALVTYFAVARRVSDWNIALMLFAPMGLFAGLLMRVILFGFRRDA